MEPESQAMYVIINSIDRMEISATPVTISVLTDLAGAFTTKPEPKMRLMTQEMSDLKIINTTGLKAKMLIPAELMVSIAHYLLEKVYPPGKNMAHNLAINNVVPCFSSNHFCAELHSS